MACNWNKEDYFPHLLRTDSTSHAALEKLVDDLHAEKDRTISSFLCHSGSEDFLWGLVRLLGEDITRVAGNAAYIIGTLAESELGCYRVLALAHSGRAESEKILPNLTRMLAFNDSESVMNAAGTMGTLAESPQGRDWMLSVSCLNMLLDHVTALLHTENMWTASNAALVIARLSISEDGCNKILSHPLSLNILVKLIMSLGTDEAGRGMNAAFAIGRLCDMESGRQRLLTLPESDKMISSLARMLSCPDLGASKNACFALSCLATNDEGHSRLLKNPLIEEVLSVLSHLLKSEDSETGWFAAMTIRTLASQPKGCVKLRDNQPLQTALKLTAAEPDVNVDLKEEVEITLDILKRLEKPNLPVIEAINGSEVNIQWQEVKPKSGLEVSYQVLEGNRSVYKGQQCSCSVDGLQPATKYGFKLRCLTENDESPFTDVVFITTLEGAPGPPTNMRVLGCTITQLKIGWDPPDITNGQVKGYHVYQGGKQVDFTTDVTSIVTGLTPNSQFTVQVCAATARGKGEKASVVGTTAELGAHAPSKPNVTVLGRNEVHVSWASPEVPFGRITRYDVIMNGKIIHTGTELSCSVHRLTPDTEYCFVVVAITSEGKFESKPTKKRTAKDEYDVTRQPLYQPPPRRDSVTEDIITSSSSNNNKQSTFKNRKSIGEIKPRQNSAKIDKNTANVKIATSSTVVVPTANEIVDRPDSAGSSVTTKTSPSRPIDTTNQHQEQIKKIKTSVKSPPLEKRRDSNLNMGGSNKSKIEFHRPSISIPVSVSNNKDVSSFHRKLTDRDPSIIKSMFPVTVSYVSIQGDERQDDLDYKIKNTGAWTRRPIGRAVVVSNKSSVKLKLDRSKALPASVGSQSSVKAKLSQPDPDVPIVLESDVLYESTDKPMDPNERNNRIYERKTMLPKPTMPSQQYLDGGKTSVSDLSKSRCFGSQGLTDSACSTDTSDSNNRNRSRHQDYIRELTSLPAFRGSPDTMFENSHNAFLQRANTFVHTHRNSLRRSSDRVTCKSSNITGGPITLNPDLPDNHTNKLHKRFVPMQTRTQPAHLPQGHRETPKISATLLEPRGYPGRRMESLARSHSSLNPHSASNRRGSARGQTTDDFINLASHEIMKQEKLSRGRPSSQVKTLNSKHMNEPDSVRLSQSWAVNAR
ncbi:uncharacterized protein LOC126808515 isoform X1 [Patella vulgata]|uniref:uncharacterized protein LOC126808515 isoform X1 n=1 Tax=Patella vulgata TaxID=6465 RepID=UPI002180608A|nr:uncharacterized protein LOC126808515 isoform X1 [Patella vulgata]